MPETSSRVPLVRCPKCGHLLPELPPYSVYCCGGCGAYLRAEKGSSLDDVLSENSCERTGEGSEREANRISKSVRSRYGDAIRKSPISGNSDARSHSSGRSVDGVVRKPPLTEIGLDGHGKSPARSVRVGVRKSPVVGEFDEHRSMGSDFVVDYEEMEAREKVGAWFDHVKEETGYANRSVTHYEPSADESELNRPRVSPRRRTWSLDESPNGFASAPRGEQIGRRDDEFVVDSSRRPLEIPHDDWVLGGDHGLPRGRGNLSVQDGYVSSVPRRFPVYPNEGPPNYPSYYGYDQPRHYQESYIGSSSLQEAEMNRAELFRLYNDLKEQLSITGDLPENLVRRGHHRISSADCYGGPEDYAYDDEPLSLRRPAASIDLDERSRMRPRYVNRSRVPVPPSRFVPNEFSFDDDPSWPQIPQRTPHHPTHFHPQRSSHEYISGHSVDSTYDSSGLNHRREGLHHPTCSCSRCHPDRPHEQSPAAQVNRRYPNYQNNAVAVFPDPYDQHSSGSRFPYSSPHGLSSHSRSSVESKSDGGGSFKEHNKRVAVVTKNQLVCHPIVGAAPFVICHSCSQLLRLPKKLITSKKTQVALQCGSCHTILSVDFGNKKSHASTQLLPKLNSTDVYDEPSKAFESDHIKTHASSAGIANRESYDFDANGYTFPCTDSEPSMQLEDRRLNSFEAQKQQGICPSSSNASKADLDLDKIPLRPPPGSPLQEHLEYSAIFSAKKSDEIEADVPGYDKGITDMDSSSLNYVQIADGMADLEIESNKVPKLDMSHSLGEASSNNDIGWNEKGEPSFAAMSSRRSEELSPPHNVLSTKDDVIVNGRHLTNREVRKAEKLAGPISPGRYWYDSRAGFWGIMGNRCLGIVPPFIEEFGSPMPVDCAGGNTGICVNGRELHEKDLELLASRGFPRTRNKSYAIDISGKVEDEETGDIVARLGKLAPTVEKTRRGFGMQPPENQED